MSNMAVSEEAIESLKSLVTSISECLEMISGEVNVLKSAYFENESGLGAHSDTIGKLIEDLEALSKDSENLGKRLGLKLSKAAVIRQAHREKNPYSTTADSSSSGNLAVDSFVADMGGLKTTMSLGSGDPGTKQMGGPYNTVARKDGPGYEAHHIPSAAALKEFGIDTKNWPTIALTSEDHAKTDSYRSKQRRVSEPFFPDSPPNSAYKDEAVELMGRGGGFFELVRDEILNIREQCGDKYDEGISQYIDSVVEYVKKHGVPTRK